MYITFDCSNQFPLTPSEVLNWVVPKQRNCDYGQRRGVYGISSMVRVTCYLIRLTWITLNANLGLSGYDSGELPLYAD